MNLNTLCRMVIAVSICAASLPASAAPDKPRSPIKTPRLGEITIDRFSHLNWQPQTDFFQSTGPVRITLTDAVTGEKTVLLADDAEGSPNGDIIVKGNLRLERAEGVVTGRGLVYHAADRTGTLHDAESEVAGVRLKGKRFELRAGYTLKAFDASFTTCTVERAHYRVTARELSLGASGRVTARDVGVWIGGTKVFVLPFMRKTFSKKVNSPIPLPGYSKEFGPVLGFREGFLNSSGTSLTLDVQISLRATPRGSFIFEQDVVPTRIGAGPDTRDIALADPMAAALTIHPGLLRSGGEVSADRRVVGYALLSSNVNVNNRKATNLRVSRLPEVGLSVSNALGVHPDDEKGSGGQVRSAFGRAFLNPRLWMANAEIGVGSFHEMPSGADAVRMGARMDAASPALNLVGPVYVRYGGVASSYWYNRGGAYTLLVPEAEVSVLVSRGTLLGAAYRYQQAFGTTPFVFDRRDVAHELRLVYGYRGPVWGHDVAVCYDLERKRAYDTSVSIRRRIDCIEFGVAYHTRSQGFGLVLNLLPGHASGAGGHTAE